MPSGRWCRFSNVRHLQNSHEERDNVDSAPWFLVGAVRAKASRQPTVVVVVEGDVKVVLSQTAKPVEAGQALLRTATFSRLRDGLGDSGQPWRRLDGFVVGELFFFGVLRVEGRASDRNKVALVYTPAPCKPIRALRVAR